MSKLEQLIEELCPNGVEYIALENLCKTNISPKKIPSNDVKDTGKYPVIDQGANFISGFTDNEQALLGLNKYIIFGDHTEIIKYVDFDFAQGADGIKILTAMNCDCRYLYHAFSCKYTKKGKYTRHWSNAKKTLIPLPPLQVQREVVRILDTFSEYTTELTEELTMRKKQYEYYRDSLLSFGDEVECKTLEEISKISRGIRVVKKELSINGKYAVYQNSMVPLGYYDKSNCKANTTFIISAGAAGKIGYSYEDFWAADDCFYFDSSKNLNNRYLCFYLHSQNEYIYSRVRKASIPRLSRTVVEKIKIPLPPLEEQQRIVDILDRFDTLCNDISKGLPAEIEARKKQYEYYRDKLLIFKKKEV